MLIMTPPPKQLAHARATKPCCPGCASNPGKPCCGSTKFAKRGSLWLPEHKPGTARQVTISRLDLPTWPRDAAFIRAVERIMPVRRVQFSFGSPVRWKRQLSTIRNLVTLPPDQWGGLVRWDLPNYMPIYDMSCTGCCTSPCCCPQFIPPNPAPPALTATIVGCGALNGGTIPMSGAVLGSCLDYTGSNLVGNCGGNVSLGATLNCPIGGANGTCEDLELEIRRTTPNCTVNGGAAQTISASAGCSCDPFSATFEGYGGVDDSGLAPGSCDCCPGGTFDVVVE